MRKIDIVVGTRPDFIRASALLHAFNDYEDTLEVRLIHTGQHYDPELSLDHLEQLLHQPVHAYLEMNQVEGLGKLASMIMSYENQVRLDRPDLTLVIGNSDSAMAAALVAARGGVPLGHIDAGTRSYDPGTTEEQNDMLIDKLSKYLFTSNEEAVINLIREGYDNLNIIEVGNIRADALFRNLGYAEDSSVLDRLGLQEGGYILVTLHHERTLSDRNFISSLLTMFESLSETLPVALLLHPRTLGQLEDMPEVMLDSAANLRFLNGQNYHDTLKLMKNALLVITDSQGLQEESTILGVQCLTIGNSTNRPVTLSKGTNTLMGFDPRELREKIMEIVDGHKIEAFPIDGWEGGAGQRIAKFISEIS